MTRPPASDSTTAQVGQYLGSGLQFAITIVLCGYGGWWVDVQWGTTPWLMIFGCLFGSVAAFYHLYRSLVGPTDHDDTDQGESS